MAAPIVEEVFVVSVEVVMAYQCEFCGEWSVPTDPDEKEHQCWDLRG